MAQENIVQELLKEIIGEINIIHLSDTNKNCKNGFLIFGPEQYDPEVKGYQLSGGKCPKYRYYAYFDLRKSPEDEEKLITFILLNPSITNDKTLDATTRNCIKIAAKNTSYNAVEILNLYPLRNSKVTTETLKAEKDANTKNKKFLTKIIEKKNRNAIVKAWGFSDKTKDSPAKDIDKILKNKVKNGAIVYRLGIDEKALNELQEKILHPANSTWSLFGGVEKAAKLVEIR